MTSIQTFKFKRNNIRTYNLNGEPLFVTSDVCKALNIGNPTDASNRLNDDEKDLVSIETPGGRQVLNCINEYGLYSLILGSRKQEAKEFKRWITHEVLPSINKTGSYSVQQNIPQTLSEALRFAADLSDKIEQQKILLIQAEPKVEFYDAVTQSHTTIDMSEVAKVLNMDLGRNKIFALLRDTGVLKADNIPYQKHVDAGYFKVIEEKKDDKIYLKTVVFQRGVDFIRKLIKKEM